MAEYKVAELAALVGGEVEGEGGTLIRGVNTIQAAGPDEITFLANPKYAKALEGARAGAVIVDRRHGAAGVTLIRVDKPYIAFGQVLRAFAPPPAVPHGVSDRAFVHATARLGADVGVGPCAVVDEGAAVGDRTTVGAGSYVGRGTTLGADCLIYPNVTLREGVRVGDRCIIHSGAVVGSDGFGFATDGGVHHKVPQIGGVVLEDDVEIGANCAIDRGTMGDTRIGRGTKLDNLIQIAHNVQVGEGVLLAAQCGIAGSTTIGDYCVFGGQVGLVGHIRIGNRVMLGAQSGVTKDIPDGDVYFGYPARPIMVTKRIEARLQNLDRLFGRVRELEKQLRESRGEKE